MKEEIKKEFKKYSSKGKATIRSRFFKTGRGEYGEGDIFIGISIPNTKAIVKKYQKDISIRNTLLFLKNPIHEYRSFALGVLRYKYSKADKRGKKKIVDIYLENVEYINNWDLVDCSAPHILGDYLLDKDRFVLYELAKSDHLWSQRISILSTFAFIRVNDFKDTLKISKMLFNHKHDLMHKAVGWMLREVWKRDSDIVEKFIIENYKDIPRTTLRYAIERMEEEKRQRFLKGVF
ncbi:TPA: DNA alkylation repair protein [Patescibacteria group bacterium]|nr:DNA alkylation repair protein [Patescibacteria group bacterium]